MIIIVGEEGIGKSALLASVALWLFEHNMYRSGIIYIDLRKYPKTDSIFSALEERLRVCSKPKHFN